MNQFKGTGKVFAFTFAQQVKSKSFIVSTVIIAAVAIILVLTGNLLIPALVDSAANADQSDAASGDEAAVNTNFSVYLSELPGTVGENAYPQYIADFIRQVSPGIKSVEYPMTSDAAAGKNNLLFVDVRAVDSEDSYNVLVYRPAEETAVDRSMAETVASFASLAVKNALLMSYGVDEGNLPYAISDVPYATAVTGEQPESEITTVIKMMTPTVFSLGLFMIIFIYGAMVAQSVATEKSTRVVELLLTSVRALALIVGKVLAMVLAALLQIVIIIVTALLALAATSGGMIAQIFGMMPTENAQLQVIADEVQGSFASFGAGSVILLIVIFILGFLLYAMFAGLVGATVSRSEDIQQAMMPYSMLGVIGLYLSYFPSYIGAAAGESQNIITLISYYVPFSAPFALPSAVILGEVSTVQLVSAVAVLALFTLLTAFVVARVYESIIIHTGDRIRFSKVFSMAVKKED
jgi:ABC-2 type transport system permease protein